MAKKPIFTGSCTAIVTPYTETGVDYGKYAELIEMQYAGGTSAILVCGTTGENPTHTAEEHDKLTELTVEKCKGRMKVIVGVGGWTNIFIYPGYKFKCMDALITNFHLPESTLVMLVSAFAGRKHILNAYNEAVANKYRFFSFGDAMYLY